MRIFEQCNGRKLEKHAHIGGIFIAKFTGTTFKSATGLEFNYAIPGLI